MSRQSLKCYICASGDEGWRELGNLVIVHGRGTRIEIIIMPEDLETLKLLFQKEFNCHRKAKTKEVACKEENASHILQYLFRLPPFLLSQLRSC